MIQMTQTQLVEYTERAIKEAIERTSPKRQATRQVLIERWAQLSTRLRALDMERIDRNWMLTEADEKKIDRAQTLGDLESITGLRAQNAAIITAMHALERAKARTDVRIEKVRLQKHREIDRLERRHVVDEHGGDQTLCITKVCARFMLEVHVKRKTADAPPLTMWQIGRLQRIFRQAM